MTREIKFRVFDKQAKKMGKVTVINFSDVQYSLVHYRYVDDRGKTIDDQSHIDDKGHGAITLMQYTGLKGKNGQEIYESDIVKVSDHPFDGSIKINGNYEIGYDDNMTLCAGSWLLHRLLPYCEVIGDVYTTPDLLGGD